MRVWDFWDVLALSHRAKFIYQEMQKISEPMEDEVRNSNTLTKSLFYTRHSVLEKGLARTKPSSSINTPTSSTPVILHTYPPMKMEQTDYSKTSAYKIPSGNYPEESIQHTEHGESLKSRNVMVVLVQCKAEVTDFCCWVTNFCCWVGGN